MGREGEKHSQGRTFEDAYSGRLCGQPDALPEIEAAVQTTQYRYARIGREQPLRKVLLTALVHAVGRCECLCIRLGWGNRSDLLPLYDGGQGLEKVATRCGDRDDGDPVVGVNRMVETRGAKCGTLC